MSTDDVAVAKAAIVERALRRVRDAYAGDPTRLTDDVDRQDVIVLNLQRACEAAIDLAMHLLRRRALGVPQESREAFRMLVDAGEIDAGLGRALQRMVGFRNVAVHGYTQLDLGIVRGIIGTGLVDIERFVSGALRRHA
jgi:uncharacterized protein YutE (UPF0331/DUF86 family)